MPGRVRHGRCFSCGSRWIETDRQRGGRGTQLHAMRLSCRIVDMEKATQQLLEDAGIDVPGALSRLMGKEDLYLRLLREFKDSSAFPNFLDAMQRGDVEGAFLALHNEKGVAANLSLEDYYQACYPAVEELREVRKKMKESEEGDGGAAANTVLRVPTNLRQLIAEHSRVTKAIGKLPD